MFRRICHTAIINEQDQDMLIAKGERFLHDLLAG